MKQMLFLLLFLTAVASAQVPVPALPHVYIDTTWRQPTGGMTWAVHTSASFQTTLDAAHPGDVIVLDAGTTYTGNFTFRAKSNPSKQWIFVISSKMSSLPTPGTRIDPRNTPNMPRIVTPNVSPAITLAPGADHYRMAGLEITTASTQGCNLANVPPIPCYTYQLVDTPYTANQPQPIPDSITIDRCYIHGSDTVDVRRSVAANGTNFAVIDSYLSDNHQSTNDSQAVLAYWTPGPIKIVNNLLSATGEDVMFGGAGGYQNPYVPSDIEIRKNHFYKPLSWMVPGLTLPPHNKWVAKNNLEFKSARRVVVTGNLLENSWMSGQVGFSLLFNIMTSQSGDLAVVDDITFENNIIVGADAGIGSTERDAQCGNSNYPNCHNPGESKRWKIDNNLLLLSPRSDGSHHMGWSVATDMTDVIFQHNTILMSDQSTCWNSLFFNQGPGWHWPPPQSYTHNVWVLDNVLCRQPSGDSGGQSGLSWYMKDYGLLDPRYVGNVMFVPAGDRTQSYPVHNYATTVSFSYANPGIEDFQLVTPNWRDTSDGKLAGVNWATLQAAATGSGLMAQPVQGSLGTGVAPPKPHLGPGL